MAGLAAAGPRSPVHVVGITGPPGAGKSTLTGRLIEAYANAGRARRRCSRSTRRARSAAARCSATGCAWRRTCWAATTSSCAASPAAARTGRSPGATRNVARLLELSGSFDVILIETVGAGQTEVAIAELADTIALVTVPGLGDAVQAIKAGLMEVADMVVVNMADRPGTPETVRHLRLTLGRDLPIATTVATEGTGVEELRAMFDERWARLGADGALAGAAGPQAGARGGADRRGLDPRVRGARSTSRART